MRAIPERLRGVFTMRRYTNTRLPLPYNVLYIVDDVGHHGTDGPLVVSDVLVTSLSEAFVIAGAELSHKFTDVNARFQQGTSLS